MQFERIEGPGGTKPRIVCVLDSHQRGWPTACGYIRLILPLSTPEARRQFDIHFVAADEVDLIDADAVIVQRLAFTSDAAIDGLLTRCRRSGARLIYEIDDDLLGIANDHTEYEYYSHTAHRIRRLIDAADEVWVSTEALATKMEPFGRTVVTIQNELDARIWKTAEPTAPSSMVRLIYMGSATHSADFHQLLKPAFEMLRREFGERVELTLVGVAEQVALSDGVRMLPPPPGVGSSYPSFANWLQSLLDFDVGLAPLLPTELNRSKSRIKWLEYSVMGLATVASDFAEYRNSIEESHAGLLAGSHPRGFYEALRSFALVPSILAELKQTAVDFANAQMAAPVASHRRLSRLSSLLGAVPAHSTS